MDYSRLEEKMDEMTSFCGLSCHECGAFQATRDNDDKKSSAVCSVWLAILHEFLFEL